MTLIKEMVVFFSLADQKGSASAVQEKWHKNSKLTQHVQVGQLCYNYYLFFKNIDLKLSFYSWTCTHY